MVTWSEPRRECPFATRREREAVGWVLTRPVAWEYESRLCGDWCQLLDKDALDCRLARPKGEE